MERRALGRTGLQVSALGLGTVELGVKYGLGVADPPSRAEAVVLLRHAVDRGITYIDTARSYGVAEELIGASGIGHRASAIIGTKCAAFYENGEDPRGEDLRRRITEEVDASLQALQLERLDLLQVHGPNAEVIERGELTGILGDLKRQGKVRAVGVAIRGEEAPLAAVRSRSFQTIQAAVSILDQRMRDRVLPEASTAGVGVIVRSVFLKGALTPRREFLPKHLELLRERADAVEDFVRRHGMSSEEAAIRFVLSLPEVSALLIGTTRVAHLDAAIAAVQKGPLPPPMMAELAAFRLDNETLVDPKEWRL